MTQRLLSFSRRSSQAEEVVDILRTLREVQPLHRQAANDSITVEYAVEGDLWPEKVEAKSLGIAPLNLVTNAREAMADGGRITISARNVRGGHEGTDSPQGPHVALTVSDSGIGIEPASFPHVFEGLFTTKKGGAAGLGLTQVSNFPQASGGRVAVSSQPASTCLEQNVPAPAAAGLGEGTPRLPVRMLIVDDTPASLEAARSRSKGMSRSLQLETVFVPLRLSEVDRILKDF